MIHKSFNGFTGDCGTELEAFSSDISPEYISDFETILPGATCGTPAGPPDETGWVLIQYLVQILACYLKVQHSISESRNILNPFTSDLHSTNLSVKFLI